MTKMRGDGTIPLYVHQKEVASMARRNAQMARALHDLADQVEAELWPMAPDAQSRLLYVVDEARAVAEGMA